MITKVKLRGAFALLLLGLLIVVAHPQHVHAEGLQIRPLLYQQKLQPGVRTKGFVDVSNATHSPTTIALKVRSFRQIDSKGNLQFFDSDTISQAVTLDLTEVDLGPSEALRVYFLIDPSKLPAGDNFAAIFAATEPVAAAGSAPAAQVGTLLLLENGAGSAHTAAVTHLRAPPIAFSDTVQGTAAVKNTADATTSSAFFPKITASLGPWFGTSRTTTGPLVFNGITRDIPVTFATHNKLGFFKLTARTSDGSASRWIFLLTGIWRWVLLLVVATFAYRSLARRYRIRLPKLLRIPQRKLSDPVLQENAIQPGESLAPAIEPEPTRTPEHTDTSDFKENNTTISENEKIMRKPHKILTQVPKLSTKPQASRTQLQHTNTDKLVGKTTTNKSQKHNNNGVKSQTKKSSVLASKKLAKKPTKRG